MPRVLVIAEHDGSALAPSTEAAVAAAARLEPDVLDVAVIAGRGEALAEAASTIAGVSSVRLLEEAANAPYLAAVWAPQIVALAQDYSHVLAPATTFGKDLLPRAAALAGVGMLSDLIAIEAPYRFRRPIYAGNAVERVAADPKRLLFATVRPTAFAARGQGGPAPILRFEPGGNPPAHTRRVDAGRPSGSGSDLQTAKRVVAGGRGLGSAEAFGRLERLAQLLGAAVGASRAAVDAGWVANELQIGQTGKIVAPELYIAVGISGAIQHLTGIKDAGTIVAINSDANAPICGLADLVLVADLFDAIPALIERLEARPVGAPA